MSFFDEIVINKSDGKIFGAGILSCLGENKNKIYSRLNLNKIDLKKKYSFKIRSLIIEEVRKLYGDVGVYSLGIGQSDGYKDPDQIKLEILIDKNKKNI